MRMGQVVLEASIRDIIKRFLGSAHCSLCFKRKYTHVFPQICGAFQWLLSQVTLIETYVLKDKIVSSNYGDIDAQGIFITSHCAV